MPWYYAEAGRQAGPVDDEAFQSLVGSGRIAPDTLVWSPGMPNWQPYGTLHPGVATAAGAPPLPDTRICSQCGRAFATDELAAFGDSLVCAYCKPIYAQRLREGVLTTGLHQYGGFWIRFVAVLIDGLIMGVVSLFYTPFINLTARDPHDTARVFIAIGILSAIGIALRGIYETWFVGRFGATPGKMVCHLKVVRPDGRPLSYRRSLCRYLAKVLNDFTFMIGYIIAAFDDEKQALHDRICDTRVIRT
jgi:uncharacterized RDD family membrane protein YckC